MRLTEDRKRVLVAMLRADDRNEYLTARELARACGERNRESDWAHGKLSDLSWYGYAQVWGIAFDNARTWKITDGGRALLRAQGIVTEGGDAPAAPGASESERVEPDGGADAP